MLVDAISARPIFLPRVVSPGMAITRRNCTTGRLWSSTYKLDTICSSVLLDFLVEPSSYYILLSIFVDARQDFSPGVRGSAQSDWVKPNQSGAGVYDDGAT